MHAARKIRWGRPVIALMECTEKVATRPHYKILQYLLRASGYVNTWSTVVGVAPMTQMTRRRWLSAWVRQDCNVQRAAGIVKFPCSTAEGWKDSSFKFQVPKLVKDQLALTSELKMIYGDPQMVPPKSRNALKHSSCHEVLQSRCIPDDAHVPTLVASYTAHHLLAPAHLQQKGIFASLDFDGNDFAFMDPLSCCAMLGTPQSLTTVLPIDIRKMFRHLGNSVAVPHALLAITVGLNTIGLDINVRQTIESAWQD